MNIFDILDPKNTNLPPKIFGEFCLDANGRYKILRPQIMWKKADPKFYTYKHPNLIYKGTSPKDYDRFEKFLDLFGSISIDYLNYMTQQEGLEALLKEGINFDYLKKEEDCELLCSVLATFFNIEFLYFLYDYGFDYSEFWDQCEDFGKCALFFAVDDVNKLGANLFSVDSLILIDLISVRKKLNIKNQIVDDFFETKFDKSNSKHLNALSVLIKYGQISIKKEHLEKIGQALTNLPVHERENYSMLLSMYNQCINQDYNKEKKAEAQKEVDKIFNEITHNS